MTDSSAYGIALKIKHPLSLAALGVVVLASLAIAVVRELPLSKLASENARDVLQILIFAVGGVAIIGFITAMVLLKPPRKTQTISTSGDLSPGEVGKDYKAVVTGLGTKAAIKQSPPRADIQTEGLASPGKVLGDYEASVNKPPKK